MEANIANEIITGIGRINSPISPVSNNNGANAAIVAKVAVRIEIATSLVPLTAASLGLSP